MRIISQNGGTDIPYELATIRATSWEDGSEIIAIMPDGSEYSMAKFDGPNEVDKAMELLHEAYKANMAMVPLQGVVRK